MMRTDATVTVRSVVFDDVESTLSLVGQAVSPGDVGDSLHSALRDVSAAARHAAVREVGAVGAGFLDLDLADLLAKGWQRYADLVKAARRTAAQPSSEEIVDIATQSFTVESRPSVEVYVDDLRRASVEFGLRLDFDVKALTAVVRSGRIIALESGHCRLTASIAIKETPVATRTAEFDLPLLIHLGEGIPLLANGR
jgi:hypothetical protein